MKTIILLTTLILFSFFTFSQKWENFKWKKSGSGLEYTIVKKGNGKKLQKSDSVNIRWIWFDCITGEEIENFMNTTPLIKWTSGSKTFIKGFEEGLNALKRGGKAYIKIPPELAWGQEGLNGMKTFCYYIEILSN
jgi:FKBP-type peptidyl-prolyl cis-trans isomerase